MNGKGLRLYIYVCFFFRLSNNVQNVPKEFSLMGSETTTGKTPPGFLHSIPALSAPYYSIESLGWETSSSFLMLITLFLKETKPLWKPNLGQITKKSGEESET